jgi:hypothetical protein
MHGSAVSTRIHSALYQGTTLVVPNRVKNTGLLAPVAQVYSTVAAQGLEPGLFFGALGTTEVVH